MEPRVHQFPGGWAVTDDEIGVFARSREEALRNYHKQARAVTHRCRINGCDEAASGELLGVRLCHLHYRNVTSRAGADPAGRREPVRDPATSRPRR